MEPSAPIGKSHGQRPTKEEPRSTQAQKGKGENQRLAAVAKARRDQGPGEYEEQLAWLSSHKLGRPVCRADRWLRSEKVPDRQQAARHAKILLENEARFIDFARSRMFATSENVVIG